MSEPLGEQPAAPRPKTVEQLRTAAFDAILDRCRTIQELEAVFALAEGITGFGAGVEQAKEEIRLELDGLRGDVELALQHGVAETLLIGVRDTGAFPHSVREHFPEIPGEVLRQAA